MSKQTSIMTLECCFYEIADALFEELRLFDFFKQEAEAKVLRLDAELQSAILEAEQAKDRLKMV